MMFVPKRLIALLCLLAGGALAPPASVYAEYLLFGATASDTKGFVCRMDGEGNLSLSEVVQIGWDTHNIAVSPDGRTVVFAGYFTSPTLNVFFVRDSGKLSPPHYLQNRHDLKGYPYHPVAFHDRLPLFYAGYSPQTTVFRYDSNKEQVEPTDWATTITRGTKNFGHSPYANSLVSQAWLDTDNDGANGIRSVRLNADGSFGELLPPLKLPRPAKLDFAVSPDGRWAAAAAQDGPETTDTKLFMAAVGPDGTLSLADALVYSDYEVVNYKHVFFSPDSQRLYFLTNGDKMLICYAIDPQTGKLTELASLPRTTPEGTLSTVLSPAITPDGRFAAFRSISLHNYNHNLIHVARLHEDGQMEYLADKTVEITQYVGPLAFAMFPPKNGAAPGWELYK